jgi:hypothetical protein
VVTFDPTTGEPVVDRRPVADKLGGMGGLGPVTASPAAGAPATRGPNQKKPTKKDSTDAGWLAEAINTQR